MQERLTQLLPRWLPSWLRRWLAREIGELLATGVYFYAWFGAILLYRTAVTGGSGAGLVAYALAVVKAAIIAKLALVAHAVPLGHLFGNRPPLQIALGKSITTLAMLVGLTALEEIARGLIHGHGIAATLSHFLHERLAEAAATCLLLWLVLIPFYLLREIGAALGPGALGRLLLGGGPPLPAPSRTDAVGAPVRDP